jgi:phosphatidylglycerol---prolipoprotein diacylglyceryl transferase
VWPILTQIGNYELGTFGVLVGIAVLLSLWLARSLGKRDDLEPRKVNDLALVALVCGFIGAKLLGVAVAFFSGARLDWTELRNAGAVHGGLLAGALAGFLLTRYFKLPTRPLLDALVPAVALGQGIGRLACLSAGCCFGSHSDLPWSISFSDQRALELGGVPLHTTLHPVQLYDASLHFLLCAVLVVMHRKNILHGRLFGVWCIAEGTVRFFVETFRGDLGRGMWLDLAWLSTGRVTALGIALTGVLYFSLERRISR